MDWFLILHCYPPVQTPTISLTTPPNRYLILVLTIHFQQCRVILAKHKWAHVTLLFKTPWWLSILLREKVLVMAFNSHVMLRPLLGTHLLTVSWPSTSLPQSLCPSVPSACSALSSRELLGLFPHLRPLLKSHLQREATRLSSLYSSSPYFALLLFTIAFVT
jgi:hypothetical protein